MNDIGNRFARVEPHINRLSGRTTNWSIALTPYSPPASDDDALAREAVAQIEEEEWPECAKHRRHGAYDGETEHRIALAAIRLARSGPLPIKDRSTRQNKGEGL